MRWSHFFTQDLERSISLAIFWRLHSGYSNHKFLNLLRSTIHSSSIATSLPQKSYTPFLAWVTI